MSFIEELELHKKDTWVEQGRWIQAVLPYTVFSYWHQSAAIKKIAPELSFHTIFSIDGHAFLHTKDRQAFFTFLKQNYQNGTLDKVAESLDREGYAIAEKIKSEFSRGDEYIRTHIRELLDLYKEMVGLWSFSAYTGDFIPAMALDVGYVQNEADLFAKVHPYLRPTWIEDEVRDVVHMAELSIKNDPSLAFLIDEYLKNYEWIKISKWIGEPITKEHVHKRIVEEVENVKLGNHIKVKHDQPNPDGLLKLCAATAFWRAECARMEMETVLKLRPLLLDLAQKNNMSYQTVLQLTSQEFVSVVESETNSIENKNELIKRQKEYFNVLTPDGHDVVIGHDDPRYVELKKMYIGVVDMSTQSKELKGVGASPGKATGTVRVVLTAQEFGDFQDGEILVAPETTPSFVPLMRMSAAILTGKGGITSHAAIVSRELKKPCVIAIKDVTKILKTGDRVEIDAGKGTVTILS